MIEPTLTFAEAQAAGWYAGEWAPRTHGPAEAQAYLAWCRHSQQVGVLVRIHGSKVDLFFSFDGLPLGMMNGRQQGAVRRYLAGAVSKTLYVSPRNARVTRVSHVDALDLIPETVRLATLKASEGAVTLRVGSGSE